MAFDTAQQAVRDCDTWDKGNKWDDSNDHLSFWLETHSSIEKEKESQAVWWSCWVKRQNLKANETLDGICGTEF